MRMIFMRLACDVVPVASDRFPAWCLLPRFSSSRTSLTKERSAQSCAPDPSQGFDQRAQKSSATCTYAHITRLPPSRVIAGSAMLRHPVG